MKVQFVEKSDSAPLLIWRPPDPDRQYVVGSDVGQGTGDKAHGDHSTACILDVLSCEQCAEWSSNNLDTYAFSYKLNELCWFYAMGRRKNLPFLVVEANPIGQGVINVLRHQCGYWNLYRRRSFDRIQGGEIDKLGFLTGERTRDELVALGQVALREIPQTIYSPRLTKELLAFMWMKKDKEGNKLKAEHSEGEKDDLVFAWMLALHGRNVVWRSAARKQKILEEERSPHPPTTRVWRAVERKRRLEELSRRFDFPFQEYQEAWKLSSWPPSSPSF
jgi:hypothetical protein